MSAAAQLLLGGGLSLTRVRDHALVGDAVTLDELRALAIHRDETGVTRFDHPYHQMSVSLEEAEFLYALVRATRPRRVLELGTGYGLSAAFIAEALDANDNGAMVFTYEPLPELRLAAQKNLEGFAAAVTGQPLQRW